MVEIMADTDNRLLALLYILMRDHLPVGVIPQILNDIGERSYSFSNAHLAEYAGELSQRILPIDQQIKGGVPITIQQLEVHECSRCAKPLSEEESIGWGPGRIVCKVLQDCVARQKSIHLQTGGKWK